MGIFLSIGRVGGFGVEGVKEALLTKQGEGKDLLLVRLIDGMIFFRYTVFDFLLKALSFGSRSNFLAKNTHLSTQIPKMWNLAKNNQRRIKSFKKSKFEAIVCEKKSMFIFLV